jgi:hypothetical protein
MPRSKRTRSTTPTVQDPRLKQPGPHRPAEFSGTRQLGQFAVINWETALGTVGLAYSTDDIGGGARRVAGELYGTHWEHMHKIYDSLVAVGAGLNLDQAPRLEAIDILPGSRYSESYEISWEQLADILGAKAPYFHHFLRDPAAILAWKPGYPPAIVIADDPDLPTAPLALLALDEPDGSPAAAVCTWLARKLRRGAAESAASDIKDLGEDDYGMKQDCAYVAIGALPAPLVREQEPEEPEQMVKLAGWAQITERRDSLAIALVDTVLRWDGGKDWPIGESVELSPDTCPIANEWATALTPDTGDKPPTIAERRLFRQNSADDGPLILHDTATGTPAVAYTDYQGTVTLTAACPQRISSFSPLAEVILSHYVVWIRTDDARLWLAPNVSGVGLSWGYHGGGPAALANLLDKLLEDITTPAVRDYGKPPKSLRELIESTPQEGTTRYTRAQLLAARAG